MENNDHLQRLEEIIELAKQRLQGMTLEQKLNWLNALEKMISVVSISLQMDRAAFKKLLDSSREVE